MNEHVKRAQGIAGELLWVSQRTRFDVAYPVNRCCSLATTDPQRAVKIGLQVLSYLQTTQYEGLVYDPPDEARMRFERQYPQARPFERAYDGDSITVYTDASFAKTGEFSIGSFVVCVLQESGNQRPKHSNTLLLV